MASFHPSLFTATPKNCIKNCAYEGPVYETSLAFAKYLGKGIKPLFTKIEWEDQFKNNQGKTVLSDVYTPKLLASGECDVFPNNLTKNNWRLKKMDFALLFPSRMMVVTHITNRMKFHSLSDLAGKTAVIGKNTSFHTWLTQQNKAIFAKQNVKLYFSKVDSNLNKILSQNADFTLYDADSAIWTTKKQYQDLAIVFPVGSLDLIGWMLRKEDKKLKKMVNQFFNAQRNDPNSEINRIWKKHYRMTLTQFISLVSAIK